MSTKDTNKESEGAASTPASNPSLNKNIIVYATDMTEEMRGSIINIAQRAFHAPVNGGGKIYQTIADLIRVEFEKDYDGAVGGDGSRGGNESSGGATGTTSGGKQLGSGGWNCVVGDAFGSSVTHRMKTYM
jgi:hypothetical protein